MTNRFIRIRSKKRIEAKRMSLTWIIILVVMNKRMRLRKLKLVRQLTRLTEERNLILDRNHLQDRLLTTVALLKRDQAIRK